MSITPEMRAGQLRYLKWKRDRAIARVEAYHRWLREGSTLRLIPAVPSDSDYKLARGEGQ